MAAQPSGIIIHPVQKQPMKSLLPLAVFIIVSGLFSCEKNEVSKLPDSYQEYLSDKIIEQIGLRDEEIYIISYFFDRNNLPPYSSMLPVKHQLTIIKKNDYKVNDKIPGGAMKPCANGKVYLSSLGQLFRIEDAGNLIPVINCDSFYIRDYAFDKQGNAWLTGEPGIMHWREGELYNYNSSNSPLTTHITHGVAVDTFDIKWIMLDFAGILKITGSRWEIIENNEIPGLTEFSYLYNPFVDNQNRVWFHVYRPDTTYTRSNILIYDRTEWKYSPSFDGGNAVVKADKYGNIWAIVNEIDEGSFAGSSIFLYENDRWIPYPVFIPEGTMIITLNADTEKLYLGTTSGLIILER
ncbi:MAG: hypothetical protein ACP5E3_12805 [Bacteroidales bacterium]